MKHLGSKFIGFHWENVGKHGEIYWNYRALPSNYKDIVVFLGHFTEPLHTSLKKT
jgi:hypothetical protein